MNDVTIPIICIVISAVTIGVLREIAIHRDRERLKKEIEERRAQKVGK